MQEYKFKFSVVIPIYNVEKYLEETIESVINQDIGFKENIQMILVNDGSPDNSEEICLKYKNMYPNNVIYVKQENAGVSAARNNGMKYIQGKYTNFLDSDDKWSLDVFSKVWNFFEDNYNKINLLSCRMKFFEARDDYHLLDYKFNKKKIIDILEDYSYIQLHITSSFIKTQVLTDYKFNEKLKYGEDADFVTRIILDKSRYGILDDAIHYYRKRLNNSSAVQNKEQKIEWYTDTIELFYQNIIRLSREKYGVVIPYIQYVLMYDLQWRVKTPISKKLSSEIKTKYINNLQQILEVIEDYIICEQKNIHSEHKVYALCLKYKRDIRSELEYRKSKLYFNNICIYNIKNKALLKIMILDIKSNVLEVEGQINCLIPTNEYNIYFKSDNGKKYNVEYFDMDNNDRYGLDGVFLKNRGFKVRIPLKNIKEIRIMINYKDIHFRRLNLIFGKFAKLNQNIIQSYYSNGKYIINTKNNILYISKNTKRAHIRCEWNYIKELFKLKKYKVVMYRVLYYFAKCIHKKDIWLLSDRVNKAGDNGEHLFKYIQKRKNKDIKTFFIINTKNNDYKRIKKMGRVIKENSLKHKIYFLLSSKIISSQANENVINAFEDNREWIKDLYTFKFIFLQHGILEKDLSLWLCRQNKNVDMFVTSTQKEYESIINQKYDYTADIVKLTGLPRYDNLKDDKKRKIIFMPTWRASLIPQANVNTGEHDYDDKFKYTEYCLFYNKLINDERLLKVLQEKDYYAKFCVHPALKNYIKDFRGNKLIRVDANTDYQKEFKENALLITDFSSVAFDFAYLRKPIIYTQFDIDTFFEGQIYDKGYFEYERDGLGPVCYDYESTVKTIIEYIEKDCVIEDKYLERINNFYAYNDQNNCKRVYEEILKLK